mmetsp:Transcript_21550/g.47010  ORF Transcript_21550/g.47010 Transcript_21550/m.47010 type:complete len:215 (-) Transcript_21550:64-708(-)
MNTPRHAWARSRRSCRQRGNTRRLRPSSGVACRTTQRRWGPMTRSRSLALTMWRRHWNWRAGAKRPKPSTGTPLWVGNKSWGLAMPARWSRRAAWRRCCVRVGICWRLRSSCAVPSRVDRPPWGPIARPRCRPSVISARCLWRWGDSRRRCLYSRALCSEGRRCLGATTPTPWSLARASQLCLGSGASTRKPSHSADAAWRAGRPRSGPRTRPP